MVSIMPRPLFTPGKDAVPIVQEARWTPGPVWTGGNSRPHRDSIPDRPARSQSLYRLSYRAHIYASSLLLFRIFSQFIISYIAFGCYLRHRDYSYFLSYYLTIIYILLAGTSLLSKVERLCMSVSSRALLIT